MTTALKGSACGGVKSAWFAGFAIAAIKVRGIGLGSAGVLFAGLFFGHFGWKIEHSVLDFAREFGLILFVFTIGLQLGLPIYSGGSLNSKEREAAALYEKAKQEQKNVRRSQALAARQNFLLVVNGISTIAALEQAVISSRSAYESNKLGYEVGVRISIDVLNAEQQVYQTSRDLLVVAVRP
jgi:hypothetical protein